MRRRLRITLKRYLAQKLRDKVFGKKDSKNQGKTRKESKKHTHNKKK